MDVPLKELFDSFEEQFGVGRGSDLLEVDGINTAFIEALFRALAELWRSSPWKRLRSKDLLGVKVGTNSDWKPLPRQPFKCVRFSGGRAKAFELDVLRSENHAVGSNGKPTRAIPEDGLLRITFGMETDLFPEVRKMIRSLGLEIAGPDAYPGLEVIYRPKSMAFSERTFLRYRIPHLVELRWLIACLKAVTQVHPALHMVRNPRASYNFDNLIQNVEFSLPATAEGYYLAEEKSIVIIRVTFPPKVTTEDSPKLEQVDDDSSSTPAASNSRGCVACLKTTAELAERVSRCGSCKAVYYCGLICQKKHWREVHKDECDQYKGVMDRSEGLKFKELQFPVLDFERQCAWLEQLGLHNKGMWRRVCKCYQSCPFGRLNTGSLVGSYAHAAAWGLEHGDYPPDAPLMIPQGRKLRSADLESSKANATDGNKNPKRGGGSPPPRLGFPARNHITAAKPKSTGSPNLLSTGEAEDSHLTVSSSGSNGMSRVRRWINAFEAASQINGSPRSAVINQGASISGWLDYYHQRGVSSVSPAAAILNYPLTIYHMATKICASTKNVLAKNKEATIHYLGPKGELDWLPAFAEIGHLLNAFHTGSLHIVMVGPEVPNSLSGEATILGTRLRITYVQGLYHEEASALLPPHMVVTLNAGLDRSEAWAADLRTVKQQAVPTFFTDYAESCSINAQQVLLAADVPVTVPVTPNPFRSPVRCQTPFTAVPWYANGFLFGVNT